MNDDQKKLKCLWCNKITDKDNLNVIYGKNNFFNKSFFYACDGEHIKKLKKFLEKSSKYYKHANTSIMFSLFIYPIAMIIFEKYFYWITIIMCLDFGSGLYFFPYSVPELGKKLGIKNMLIFLKTISIFLIVSGLYLLIQKT